MLLLEGLGVVKGMEDDEVEGDEAGVEGGDDAEDEAELVEGDSYGELLLIDVRLLEGLSRAFVLVDHDVA